MSLAGTLVAFWFLTQEVAEVAGSSPFTVVTNFLSANSVKTLGKTPLSCLIVLLFQIIKLSFHFYRRHVL